MAPHMPRSPSWPPACPLRCCACARGTGCSGTGSSGTLGVAAAAAPTAAAAVVCLSAACLSASLPASLLACLGGERGGESDVGEVAPSARPVQHAWYAA